MTTAMQATPPATHEKVGVVTAAVAPARTSPRRGPPATTAMKPCIRPRISSGAVGLEDGLPVDRADQVERAGEGEQGDDQPQLADQAGHGDRGTPADDRQGERAALAADLADPAARQPGDDGTDGDGGVERADLPAEPVVRDGREQRPAWPGRYGGDVDGEAHEEHRTDGDEPQPLRDRLHVRPLDLPWGGIGRRSTE